MTEPDVLPATPARPGSPLGLTPDAVRGAAAVAAQILGAYLGLCAALALPVAALSDAHLGVLGTLKAVVILAAMGLHGALFFKADGGSESLFNGSLQYVFVPLLVLGLVLALAFVIGRRAERTSPSATVREALASSGITAAVATVTLIVLAAASHLRTSDGLDFGGGDSANGAVVGASVVQLVVWGIPLLFLALAAGHLSQTLPRTAGTTLRTWLARPTHGVSGWVVASAQHLAVSAVGLTIGGIVYGLFTDQREIHEATSGLGSDVAGFLVFLYVLPNLAVAATGAFLGFSVGSGGVGSFVGGRDAFGLLHGDLPAVQYLWVLVPLVAAAGVGTRHALQEGPRPRLLENWWRAGLGSVLLWLPMTVLLKIGFGGSLGGASIGVGYTALSWVPLSFAWGVLLLVLGRRLAGPVAQAYPGLAARLAPPVAEAPDAVLPPGTDLPGTVLPSTDVLGASGPVLSRRTTLITGVVLAALVLGTVAYKVVDAKVYGPSSATQEYLDALAAGDVSKAVRLRTDDTSRFQFSSGDTPGTQLLEGPSLPAGRRITDAKIGAITRHGTFAQAKVTYLLGGTLQHDTLQLRQHGSRAGVFHGWQVLGGENDLNIYVDGATDVLVNGVAVHLSDGRADLTALPGLYEVTLPETSLLTLNGEPGRVTLQDSGDVSGRVTLSAQAESDATAAVTTYLTSCLAKATTLQTTCGFTAYTYGDSYEKVHWALDGTPSFDVSFSGGQILVSNSGAVSATVTGIAVQQGFFGSPATRQPFTDHATNYLSGHIDPGQVPFVFVPE